MTRGISAIGGNERKKLTRDRKSTRLNSSHEWISYAVFGLKKKKIDTVELVTLIDRIRRTGGSVQLAAVANGTITSADLLTFGQTKFFFFTDTATTELYPLSLHDALPIFRTASGPQRCSPDAVRDAHASRGRGM